MKKVYVYILMIVSGMLMACSSPYYSSLPDVYEDDEVLYDMEEEEDFFGEEEQRNISDVLNEYKDVRYCKGTCVEESDTYILAGNYSDNGRVHIWCTKDGKIIKETYDENAICSGNIDGYVLVGENVSKKKVKGHIYDSEGNEVSIDFLKKGESIFDLMKDSTGITLITKVETDTYDSHETQLRFRDMDGNIKYKTKFLNIPVQAKTVTVDGHTYKLVNRHTTWHKAKRICESKGVHLATINSEDEQDAIIELLEENDLAYEGYWLGGRKNTKWKWITGEKMKYTYFSSASVLAFLSSVIKTYLFSIIAIGVPKVLFPSSWSCIAEADLEQSVSDNMHL